MSVPNTPRRKSTVKYLHARIAASHDEISIRVAGEDISSVGASPGVVNELERFKRFSFEERNQFINNLNQQRIQHAAVIGRAVSLVGYPPRSASGTPRASSTVSHTFSSCLLAFVFVVWLRRTFTI